MVPILNYFIVYLILFWSISVVLRGFFLNIGNSDKYHFLYFPNTDCEKMTQTKMYPFVHM